MTMTYDEDSMRADVNRMDGAIDKNIGRIDTVRDDLLEVNKRIAVHEAVCGERYSALLKRMDYVTYAVIVLALLEAGKQYLPTLLKMIFPGI